VTAEGGGRRYRSASDKEGWFELAVPKPGRYTVLIFLPPGAVKRRARNGV
jgi:hypothetical protein